MAINSEMGKGRKHTKDGEVSESSDSGAVFNPRTAGEKDGQNPGGEKFLEKATLRDAETFN